jgi:multiple sugar transport system permease protein
MSGKLTPLQILSFLLVGLWLVIAAFPFLWTLWGSFKVQSDFFSKADWTNALYGVNTLKETGGAFTGDEGLHSVALDFYHSHR